MALFLKYFSGLPGNSCNTVSYPTRTMCVLQGTSVDISCTYSHPPDAKLIYKSWFKWRANQEPRDLQSDSEYEGRVEYPVEETGRSTLRITDLRVTDSAEYRFTFKTSYYEWKGILHGTTLTVTGLRVEVTPVATVTEGQRVTLTCITSCPLADKPSYIWYQNNGPVTGSENPENQLVLDPVGPQHAGSYSCSVRNYPHLRSPEETLTVQYKSSLTTVAVGTVAVLLVIILLLIFLCMRRKRASRKARGQRGRPDTGEQALPDPVYDNVLPLTNRLAPAAQREPVEEQDDLHYASIHIPHSENQEVPRRSAGSPVQSRQTEEVLYSLANFIRPNALNLCVLFILNEMCLFFTALQGNDDWTVTCTSSNVCSVRGSTVDISCTFKYPEKQHDLSTTVLETLWFTKEDRNQKPVDLLSDADYTGRVESSCGEISCIGSSCNRKCTLSIRDLRQSDSAVYNFRFKTNQPGGEHTANPGVALSNYVVLHLCHLFSDPDLQVKVSLRDYQYIKLECDSMCANAPIIWYINGQYYGQGRSIMVYFDSIYSYSCAVEGYERLHSPSVCKSTPSLSTATHEEVNNFRVTKIGQIKYQNQVRPVAPFFHFIFLIRALNRKYEKQTL
ncbi:Sialoadhesin [Merluccius polli]|uniref:Sialoadhesin n=1 Tax=Merluccius polli TaxID=89951 RepID=A0AA47N4M7_MERPO|nr:Sialoadhesin [Merluccius polli]